MMAPGSTTGAMGWDVNGVYPDESGWWTEGLLPAGICLGPKRHFSEAAFRPSGTNLVQKGCYVSVMLLCDQLPDLGHQIVRHIHDGLRRLNTGFILRQCLVFGLFSVVGKDPLYFVLIPAVWKFVLAH